jgi:hypothetical protein
MDPDETGFVWICCFVFHMLVYTDVFLPVLLATMPMKAGGKAIAMQPKNETTDKTWALLVVFIENIL